MLEFEEYKQLIQTIKLYPLLSELEQLYPDFRNWFFNKVIPSVVSNHSTIIVLKKNNIIVGLTILKTTHNEKKIRTLYILKDFQGQYGLFIKLFEKSMEVLNTFNPSYSVPEELIDIYTKIAKKYNHNLTQVIENKYRNGKKEYFFNGIDKKESLY